MSLDRRIREAFDRVASTVDPDIERRLEQTLRRASRLNQASVVGMVMAATAATVALIVAVQVLSTPSGDVGGPSVAQPSPSAGDIATVVGTYTVVLLDTDPGVETSGLNLTGTWTLTLDPSGAVDIVPPPSFEGSRAAGHTFSLDGSTLRTDLYYNDYCSSVGTYTWDTTDDGLVLTPVVDPCEIRLTLLSTRSWERAN